MDTAVFVLCAATSLLCAGLLVRAYLVSRGRLLLGALVCFVGFAINNVLLLIDEVFLDQHEFHWRGIPAVVGMLALLWTLIAEDA
jgi:hypothetical protein